MGRGGASGMEGGGSAWRSPCKQGYVTTTCNQRCVTTTWYRLLISIMFRLLLLSILLQAKYSGPQQMGFYVQESCVDNPQLNNNGKGAFFFIDGCTARVTCTYLNVTEDYCSKRNTTDIALMPCSTRKDQVLIPACDFPNRSLILNSMVEVQKTKCNIIVDIQNITTQFVGAFQCQDRDYPEVERHRNVYVGKVPEAPQNLSLVYEPWGNITLWLDPVKQGYELNDNYTTWNVNYDWLYSNTSCSKNSDSECKQLNPEGLCRPCFIKLKKKEGCGQHASQGSVFNKIHFNISVDNIFATVPALNIQPLFPPDWIKPGPVSSILIQKINSSQFRLKVTSPIGFDQCHFNVITTESNKLVYNYTVDLVSLKEQNLLQEEGKLFYETYGFVRNLEDDEMALSQANRSDFPQHSAMYVWESSGREATRPKLKRQNKEITGLPFAGYLYNISVQTKAHYWGKTIWEKEMTSETAPREGPQLDENFAYCPLINESCAVCLIYFKEIPRTRRGGTVLNHSLSLTLLNEDISMQSKCGNSRMEETTGGQNNTFLVVGLPVGGVYNISLRASTSEGWSPNTTAVLHVLPSPPTSAAQNIVLESSGASYDLSWKPGRSHDNTQLRYIVHNCPAIALQLYPDGGNGGGNESTLPTVPLNCVTNMVSNELPENHTNSFTFDGVPEGKGLTPVFFLSIITPTNLTSGLLPVDCFYAKNTVPDKAKSLDVQAMENDPGGIKVTFQLPCGQDLHYNYGRPDSYSIGVEKDDGSVKCSKTMTGPGLDQFQISGNLKKTVEYERRELDHDSNYCVCVYLFARNDNAIFQQNGGFCKNVQTGTEPESTFPVWVMNLLVAVAAILGLVFITFAMLKCKRSYRKNKEKFGTLDERKAMVPTPPVKKKLQNGDVRVFINPKILSQDSGVHSPTGSHCVIDIPSDRPLVDPAGDELSDQEEAEYSEEENQNVEEGEYRVDEGSATDKTNSRYQSQSSNTESADNSQASRGTAGRQAAVKASRYSPPKRYSSQFAGERDMEEDEEEEDLEEEETEEGETEEEGEEESERKSAASEDGHEEREGEGLDTKVHRNGGEAEHLDSNDIKISMQVPPLSRQKPGPDRHLANKKPLPLAVAAILQQGSPSLQASEAADLPHHLHSSPVGPSADEIVLAFNTSTMASTVAPGDGPPPASKATDSPQQDPQSSPEKPSIEEILEAFSLPPAISAVDAVDVGPSDDAARTLEGEGLDTKVHRNGGEAEHLDSNDIKISMQVPPLSRQKPGPDRHLANKKPLPLAVAAILQQGSPSLQASEAADLPHHLHSSPVGPSADEIVLAFNTSTMASTVAPGDGPPPASKATDSPQQDPQSSPEKPSIEEFLEAFSLPPAISAVDAVDVGPSDDAARTRAMSVDSSPTDDIDPQKNSLADVCYEEILATPQAVIDSNADSNLDGDVKPDGETEDQLCVEDILLAADSSKRSQEASNQHPAVDTQKTADMQALVSASAEVKGAESASSRDTQKHDAEDGLVKAEACAEPERDSEAAIASSTLSRPQLPQQDMSSIDDILLASQGCEWKSDLDSNPNVSHSEGNDSPKTSSSESNRDSIRLSGEFESGFESESAKETDGETDRSSTDSLVAKKIKEGQCPTAGRSGKPTASLAITQDIEVPDTTHFETSAVPVGADQATRKETMATKQLQEHFSAINPSYEITESKPTENEAGFGKTVENECLEDNKEVRRKSATTQEYEPKHSASDHVNGSVVSDIGVSRSKHSANNAVKRLSSDIVPLLGKKNGLESSDSSDSNEFVSDNKAFSMEENSAKKAEQGRTEGSNKYCKVTRESRV